MKYEDIAQDMQGLLGARADSQPSRRTALRAALGAGLGVGYACAAGPVMAQTAIKTPVDGLTAGEVSIDVKGFKLPAYRAMPAGKQNLPVVLVISEIFGVHEYIADTCRRLARAGYLAIAPDLFVRQGDPMAYAEMAKLMSEVIAKVPDAQAMGDLDAAVQWAGTQGGDIKKLAITGFCWGGRITWLYAAHAPLKAGVAWYGRLQGNKNDLQPSYPLDLVGQLKAPVLGLYGGKDTGIPLESVEAMKAALKTGSAAARASEFVIFPEAPHAFHADYRPSYREQAAQEGWTRMLTWFNQHGVA
ncbi:dienelactone hydrolase family protein [Comamonas sp. Tr-654]|uniref:dienelactone hydrolase family protein n=1 Tax=Comamonas sp. Tr-654 TaxID=2608341 RepID=UPI00141F38A6|nr:dienelactone hydrolase family protein [Comamonas sp. Tr-654]NIF84037.1 dienelactone hydrolase family protein [Comamonas sp. Tr-654]